MFQEYTNDKGHVVLANDKVYQMFYRHKGYRLVGDVGERTANPHTPATRKWYMFELDSLGAKYAVTDRLDTLEGLYNSAKEG